MRTALYARVSTRDKGQDIDNQLHDLRTHCARQGWEVVTEYVEEVSGAKAESQREQFAAMMQAAHQRKFDLLLFWSLDRLTREGASATLNYLARLTAAGVQYKSYTEQYLDTTGIFADAIISILATVAKQERLRLSERTKAGVARARREGKKLGRPGLGESIEATMRVLARKGFSNRAIAKQLGVSPSSVDVVVKAMGNAETW